MDTISDRAQQFIDACKNLDIVSLQLQDLSDINMTQSVCDGNFHGKMVFADEEETLIFKIMNVYETRIQIKLIEKAQEAGLPQLFLPREIKTETSTFILTREKYLNKWRDRIEDFDYIPERLLYENAKLLSARVYQDYTADYDKIADFFELYELRGVSQENAGINSNGKLQIFDWYGIYGLDSKGEIYIKRDAI